MKLRFYIFAINILFIFQLAYSQPDKSDSLVQVYFKEARQNISEKNYGAAKNSFNKLFNLKTTLPDEVAYFYGVTLLNLKNYLKAKAAFEKYISLTREKGQFYNDSKKFIAEADNHICKICNNTGMTEEIDSCSVCIGTGKTFEACQSCKNHSIELCAACAGKGVITTKTSFGSSYQACKSCEGNGYVSCTVCGGTKKKTVYCSNCKGKGIFRKKVSCHHQY